MLDNIDLISILGSGTLGSIGTMVVQKILDRKKDTTDITASSVNILTGMNDKLNSVIEQLQEKACYDEECEDRINGLTNCTDCNKKKVIIRKRRKK